MSSDCLTVINLLTSPQSVMTIKISHHDKWTWKLAKDILNIYTVKIKMIVRWLIHWAQSNTFMSELIFYVT